MQFCSDLSHQFFCIHGLLVPMVHIAKNIRLHLFTVGIYLCRIAVWAGQRTLYWLIVVRGFKKKTGLCYVCSRIESSGPLRNAKPLRFNQRKERQWKQGGGEQPLVRPVGTRLCSTTGTWPASPPFITNSICITASWITSSIHVYFIQQEEVRKDSDGRLQAVSSSPDNSEYLLLQIIFLLQMADSSTALFIDFFFYFYKMHIFMNLTDNDLL